MIKVKPITISQPMHFAARVGSMYGQEIEKYCLGCFSKKKVVYTTPQFFLADFHFIAPNVWRASPAFEYPSGLGLYAWKNERDFLYDLAKGVFIFHLYPGISSKLQDFPTGEALSGAALFLKDQLIGTDTQILKENLDVGVMLCELAREFDPSNREIEHIQEELLQQMSQTGSDTSDLISKPNLSRILLGAQIRGLFGSKGEAWVLSAQQFLLDERTPLSHEGVISSIAQVVALSMIPKARRELPSGEYDV